MSVFESSRGVKSAYYCWLSSEESLLWLCYGNLAKIREKIKMNITTKTVEMPLSPSLAEIQAQKVINLDRLRKELLDVDIKDLVPLLVARHVLRSYEMMAVYAQQTPDNQKDKLIEILKTKHHWVGPLVDALIRNGQPALAEAILKQNSTSTTI